MAHEKSCTSAKMGEREVRIIVMPISSLIVPNRWNTTDIVMGSTDPLPFVPFPFVMNYTPLALT